MDQDLPTYPMRDEARALCMSVGAAAVLGGLISLAAALTNSPPIWFSVAFQALIVVAGVFCVLLGRGRFTEAPALAVLCCSGTMLVGGLLSEVTRTSAIGVAGIGPRALAVYAAALAAIGAGSAGAALVLVGAAMKRGVSHVAAWLIALGVWGAAWGVSVVAIKKLVPAIGLVMPWDAVLLGGLLAGVSASAALVRRPERSIRQGVVGAVLCGASLAVVAAGFAGRGVIGQANGMVAAIAVLLTFVLWLGLLSAGVHYVVRAFEQARLERNGSGASG